MKKLVLILAAVFAVLLTGCDEKVVLEQGQTPNPNVEVVTPKTSEQGKGVNSTANKPSNNTAVLASKDGEFLGDGQTLRAVVTQIGSEKSGREDVKLLRVTVYRTLSNGKQSALWDSDILKVSKFVSLETSDLFNEDRDSIILKSSGGVEGRYLRIYRWNSRTFVNLSPKQESFYANGALFTKDVDNDGKMEVVEGQKEPRDPTYSNCTVYKWDGVGLYPLPQRYIYDGKNLEMDGMD